MTGEYKIVVGCPNLRVYKGDIVVSSNNKPLLFNGYDESTVLNLNSRVRRVRKKDIIYCANNGINLLLFLKKHPLKNTTRRCNINQIRLYDDWCDWGTRCAVGIREKDVAPVLQFLYKRINNYITHLSYLDIDYNVLYDIVSECCIDIANDIVNGTRVVFSPDKYIITTAKNKYLKSIENEQGKKNF